MNQLKSVKYIKLTLRINTPDKNPNIIVKTKIFCFMVTKSRGHTFSRTKITKHVKLDMVFTATH